jgi:hypothetical protein
MNNCNFKFSAHLQITLLKNTFCLGRGMSFQNLLFYADEVNLLIPYTYTYVHDTYILILQLLHKTSRHVNEKEEKMSIDQKFRFKPITDEDNSQSMLFSQSNCWEADRGVIISITHPS